MRVDCRREYDVRRMEIGKHIPAESGSSISTGRSAEPSAPINKTDPILLTHVRIGVNGSSNIDLQWHCEAVFVRLETWPLHVASVRRSSLCPSLQFPFRRHPGVHLDREEGRHFRRLANIYLRQRADQIRCCSSGAVVSRTIILMTVKRTRVAFWIHAV